MSQRLFFTENDYDPSDLKNLDRVQEDLDKLLNRNYFKKEVKKRSCCARLFQCCKKQEEEKLIQSNPAPTPTG